MKKKWIIELSHELLRQDTVEDMTDFLHGLLTEGELEEIARRVQIIKNLKKGIPQHTIAKQLGVGVATVTRGSKELQKGRFKQVLSSKF